MLVSPCEVTGDLEKGLIDTTVDKRLIKHSV